MTYIVTASPRTIAAAKAEAYVANGVYSHGQLNVSSLAKALWTNRRVVNGKGEILAKKDAEAVARYLEQQLLTKEGVMVPCMVAAA